MKTRILLLIIILMVTQVSFAQREEIYQEGLYGFYTLIGKNIKYPLDDRNKGLEGQVLLKVRVNVDHSIDSISVVNSISPAIDNEAIRVIQISSGNWSVNETNFYLVPITFKLSFPGRTEDESIKKDIIKQLKKKDYKKAIENLEEIRRRKPLDLDNLSDLIFAYGQVSDSDNERKIKNLKEEIEYFVNAKRRVGGK